VFDEEGKGKEKKKLYQGAQKFQDAWINCVPKI
jgi:hypothetical protein